MTRDELFRWLAELRDVLATPQGARLLRELDSLRVRALEAERDEDSYAARLVSRTLARAHGQLPPRRQRAPKRKA